MEVDSSWDTEKYRTKFESEEHWELKKEFLEAHKETIPEDRLICLAQVFVNIELLRCKYPDKVMEQVNLLAKQIGHDYKANQKKRLQRTFVKASDAASAKVKGIKANISAANQPPENLNSPCKKSLISSNDTQNKAAKGVERVPKMNPPSTQTATNRLPAIPTREIKRNSLPGPSSSGPVQYNPDNPYRNICVVHYSYSKCASWYGVLLSALNFSKYNYVETFEVREPSIANNTICYMGAKEREGLKIIDLACGKGPDKKSAKKDAAMNSVSLLLQHCYLVKILKKSSSDGEISLNSGTADEKNNDKLDEENKGAKLLKMMGWSGGGLGKDGQGIVEPVQASSVIGRAGLGLLCNESVLTIDFKKRVHQILQNFAYTKGMSDVVFTPDLSSEHRKYIHMEGRRYKKFMKTTSYGRGSNRYLMISRKMSGPSLIQKIMEEGGETDKYKVFKPGTFNLEEFSEEMLKEPNAVTQQVDSKPDPNTLDAPSPVVKANVPPTMPTVEVKQNVLPSPPSRSVQDDPDRFKYMCVARNMFSRFRSWYFVMMTSMKFSDFLLKTSYSGPTILNPYTVCSLSAKEKLGDKVVELSSGKGEGNNKKNAREDAAKNAIFVLLQHCYCIKILKRTSSDGEISLDIATETPAAVDTDSKGAKMMRLMGWTGGGLGKDGQGIVEPLELSTIMGRAGLGQSNNENVITKEFKANVNQILQNYVSSEGMSDLRFSTDLTSQHRKYINLEACRYRNFIRAELFGKDPSCRYLVISRKYSVPTLIQKILDEGGETDKYKLHEPGTLTLSELSEDKPGTHTSEELCDEIIE